MPPEGTKVPDTLLAMFEFRIRSDFRVFQTCKYLHAVEHQKL